MAAAINRTRTDQRKLKEVEISNNNGEEMTEQKTVSVPIVYYLSRNGQLEHPHFMEVPLSSSHGLFLRDVIRRLNLLRGHSMAFHYSWSSKRSYKNGFVWQDLAEDDYIHPVNGGEYVLKGSEILETTSLSLPSPSLSKSVETTPSPSSGKNNINPSGSSGSEFPPSRNRRRNQSWGAIDLHEYKVYKAESSHEFAAADASTQTDDKRRRRKGVIYEEPEMEEGVKREKGAQEQQQQSSVELGRGEISPPPPDSSPETLESLMKADGRLIINTALPTSSASQSVDGAAGTVNQTAEYCQNGKMKASSVLMSLISCGSISFRDCGVTAVKDHGLSLISHYNKPRVPRGGNQTVDDDEMRMTGKDMSCGFAKMGIEDKEYFSGSLIETNKNKYKEDNQFISLKRSSSYNADRSSHLKMEGKEVEGVRAKCIPRRPKAQPSNRKECPSEIASDIINNIENGSQN